MLTVRDGQCCETENGRAQQRAEGQGAPAPAIQEKDEHQISRQFRNGGDAEREEDAQS